MKTPQEIIEAIQIDATARAIAGRRVQCYRLCKADYDRAHDFIAATAGPIPLQPASFDAGYFYVWTKLGAVKVASDDAVNAGELGVNLEPRKLSELKKDESSPGFPPARAQGISMTGKWRVYFNRHGAEPLMWCIAPDAGGWEIAVRDVQLATIAETMYQKKPTADEDDGRPSAWFAVEGVLTINLAGFATIGAP